MSDSDWPHLERLSSDTKPKVRWWPVALVVTLFAARCFQIWFFRDSDRQFKVQGTFQGFVISASLLLVWLLGFSRLRFRVRFLILGIILAGASVTALLVRVRGVTGDRIPILEWRWERTPSAPEHGPGRPTQQPPADRQGTPVSTGDGFPQFLGPRRDGILQGPQLARDWKAQPPQLLWRQPVGAGWSGFAVRDRFAITLEQADLQERIACHEVRTGVRIWHHEYPARFNESSAGLGPRSVPTIAGDRVYACGATGVLTCLELATGREIWSHHLLQEHQAKVPNWGFSCSPLVHEDQVIVTPGGPGGHSIAAYGVGDGKLRWSRGDHRAGYSSPILGELDGQLQILVFDHPGVTGYTVANGDLLWHHPIPTAPHVANPLVVSPHQLLVSCGNGIGTYQLSVRRGHDDHWATVLVWKTPRLKSKFANLIPIQGFVYGLDDGRMACLEIATGNVRWKAERYGHGQLLLVSGLLLVMAENGEVALVDPSPESFRELTRFPALSGKTWNPPALAGQYLLLRNDQEAACYRLPLASDTR